jgi:hypothetical protein
VICILPRDKDEIIPPVNNKGFVRGDWKSPYGNDGASTGAYDYLSLGGVIATTASPNEIHRPNKKEICHTRVFATGKIPIFNWDDGVKFEQKKEANWPQIHLPHEKDVESFAVEAGIITGLWICSLG